MNMSLDWQLPNPVSTIVFDCDGTLSCIEGIDELAKANRVGAEVEALTQLAMGQTGINPKLYQKRLELVHPTAAQVKALGEQYFTRAVPDSYDVIQILKRLNKSIYIVSAGLYPAVSVFGQLLKIPAENIFAVDIQFDQQGHFLSYDHTSPLVDNAGKREIIKELKKTHAEILYSGDGLNDLAVIPWVRRFVGYGGQFYRQNIAAACQYYIQTPSLSPLLCLALTAAEYAQLLPHECTLYEKGKQAYLAS